VSAGNLLVSLDGIGYDVGFTSYYHDGLDTAFVEGEVHFLGDSLLRDHSSYYNTDYCINSTTMGQNPFSSLNCTAKAATIDVDQIIIKSNSRTNQTIIDAVRDRIIIRVTTTSANELKDLIKALPAYWLQIT
jgi:hypothetical protein